MKKLIDIFFAYDFLKKIKKNRRNTRYNVDILQRYTYSEKFGNEKMLINLDKKDIILRNQNNFSRKYLQKY